MYVTALVTFVTMVARVPWLRFYAKRHDSLSHSFESSPFPELFTAYSAVNNVYRYATRRFITSNTKSQSKSRKILTAKTPFQRWMTSCDIRGAPTGTLRNEPEPE